MFESLVSVESTRSFDSQAVRHRRKVDNRSGRGWPRTHAQVPKAGDSGEAVQGSQEEGPGDVGLESVGNSPVSLLNKAQSRS